MNDFLRHAVATVAYRGGKVLRDAPPSFADFRAADKTRTPVQILAHIGDLFDWACVIARGEKTWKESPPQSWDQEAARFFDALSRFDAILASDKPLECDPQRLFQGPIADALTHVGQLALLRRLAEAPIRGENYFVAEIVAGRVGEKQTPPRREF